MLARSMFNALALVLAGSAIGWTASFSFLIAPMAFRELDAGRADRFVRNAIQSGHTVPSLLCVIGAAAAWFGAAPGAAALLGIAALLFFVARFTVSPGARRRKATRIAASGLTAALLPLTAVAAALAVFGV